MRTVYLVSCVSKKKRGMHPARDAYDSPWFKKALAYVEQRLKNADSWFILSAKHGLVGPGVCIDGYDKTLKDMPLHEREEWATGVVKALQPIIGKQDRVVMLAGKRYREFLLEKITDMCHNVEVPMEGMRIGEQLRWLSGLRGNDDR